MLLDLKIPAARRDAVAHALKQAYDELRGQDGGWIWVDFGHLIVGRDVGGPVAERIPGDVIISDSEPEAPPDAWIIKMGFADPFTGDVTLTGGEVIAVDETDAPERAREVADDSHAPPRGLDDETLAAVALFVDGDKLHALTGTVGPADETPAFRAGTGWPALDEAIAARVQTAARG